MTGAHLACLAILLGCSSGAVPSAGRGPEQVAGIIQSIRAQGYAPLTKEQVRAALKDSGGTISTIRSETDGQPTEDIEWRSGDCGGFFAVRHLEEPQIGTVILHCSFRTRQSAASTTARWLALVSARDTAVTRDALQRARGHLCRNFEVRRRGGLLTFVPCVQEDDGAWVAHFEVEEGAVAPDS